MFENPSTGKQLLELKAFKKHIELYLRALWNQGFYLLYADGNNELPFSRLVDNKIHLPETVYLNNHYQNYYRAAAVHASLHAIFSDQLFEVKDLNLMQRSIIGLVEDLRIELLALEMFPGLRKMWLSFHSVSKDYNSAQNLIKRLSRSVLDPEYQDASNWVIKGKQLILSCKEEKLDSDAVMDIGLRLANDLGQMRMPLNSGKYEQPVLYRDDNSCLWQDIKDQRDSIASVDQIDESDIYQKHLKEASLGRQLSFTETDINDTSGFLVAEKEEASLEYNKSLNDVSRDKVAYPEWDYRSHVLKENWCNLIEQKSTPGSIEKTEEIFKTHIFTLNRLHHLAKQLQMEKRQRTTKLEDGDDLDLDLVVNAMVSVRSGEIPDSRIFMRDDFRHVKSLSISVLMDLSESTNDTVGDSDVKLSELMRDAVLLLGQTLFTANEEFAISGFSSDGRHEINFIKFKEFNENFEQCRSRLADVKGENSTRLGTAIRHAAKLLAQQASMKKLLLVITDGAPSDIDVFDKKYLEKDSWHAVNTLAASNIKSYCINLDNTATPVIEHIFGKGRFETLDDVSRLPKVLSDIYIKYAHH